MAQSIAIFTRPDGSECYYQTGLGHWPGERAQAFRFNNPEAARRAASSVIHGEPGAFWPSERRHNELTRAAHRGWQYRVEGA